MLAKQPRSYALRCAKILLVFFDALGCDIERVSNKLFVLHFFTSKTTTTVSCVHANHKATCLS